MKILVTGAAGFIGMHVSSALLNRGDVVVGLDNLDDYYDVSLKEARLRELGSHKNFTFAKADVADASFLDEVFRASHSSGSASGCSLFSDEPACVCPKQSRWVRQHSRSLSENG